MKPLNEFLKEGLTSALLHEINVGDYVQFESSGHTIFGEIIEINDKQKCIVKPMGFKYKSEEEKKEIESKLKKKYTVNPRKCYLVTLKKKSEN